MERHSPKRPGRWEKVGQPIPEFPATSHGSLGVFFRDLATAERSILTDATIRK